MNTLYFPLVIESTAKSIKLSETSRLIRIDNRKVANLIGIRNVSFSTSGHISHIAYHENAVWRIWAKYLYGNNITHNLRVSQTNFVLSVPTRQEAVLIAFAMKLLAGTLSGPYIGFSDEQDYPLSVQFLTFIPYWGKGFLVLQRKEISLLRKLLASMNSDSMGGKLNMIIEKYLYAESANASPRNLRFLELAIILEMIFLPKSNSELSYRFQLRIAKWFRKHHGDNIKSMATKAKRIYKLRSNIAHSGTAKIGDDDLNNVRHLTRIALRNYVLDPSKFTDKYLDELCLLG